jgi:glycosyltransferase involved in cell wall biosynthesis
MYKVIYSNGARIAGGGIGNTSYHAAYGLYRHEMLTRLICGSARSGQIPNDRIKKMGNISRALRKLAVYDRTNRVDYFYRRLYAVWASRQVMECDVFLGWSGYSLNALQSASSRGAITILDRALAHPRLLDRLLRQEHEQYGLPPIPSRITDFVSREIELADYILIPSDFVRETCRAEGVPDEKLIQIPFGVDINRFQPVFRPPGEKFRALFVGQVSIRKGVHILLEAWRLLGWQDAELWLAGRVELPGALLKKYQDLSGVCFLGHVSPIQQIFQQADVFVFPSLAEGSALVTYEAMACGLPIIATFNAGSVAHDEEHGFIVPIHAPEIIADRLEKLRTDQVLHTQMGKAGRNRIEMFTWYHYGDRVAEALSACIAA